MLRFLVFIILCITGLLLNAQEQAVSSAADVTESTKSSQTSSSQERMPAEHQDTDVLPSGEMISLKTAFGTSFSAYTVGNLRSEYGVLIIPDRWGLSEGIKQQANRFASMGYHAVAVDLYDGRRVMDARMADEVLRSIDPIWVEANLMGALEYLSSAHKQILAMGWGIGADYALQLASQAGDAVTATVLYYGDPTDDAEVLRLVNGPVLNVMARLETREDRLSAESFQSSMRALGKTVITTGIDAQRGFANPRSGTYDQDAARSAWQSTRDFLSTQFEAGPVSWSISRFNAGES